MTSCRVARSGALLIPRSRRYAHVSESAGCYDCANIGRDARPTPAAAPSLSEDRQPTRCQDHATGHAPASPAARVRRRSGPPRPPPQWRGLGGPPRASPPVGRGAMAEADARHAVCLCPPKCRQTAAGVIPRLEVQYHPHAGSPVRSRAPARLDPRAEERPPVFPLDRGSLPWVAERGSAQAVSAPVGCGLRGSQMTTGISRVVFC